MQLKTTFSTTMSAAQRGLSSDQTGPRNGQPGSGIVGVTEQLRGNSADEVLGSMNQASLMQGIVMASIVTVVLMAVLTIGPFLFGSGPKKKGGKPAAAAAQSKEQTPAESKDAGEGTDSASESSTATANASGGSPKVSAKSLKNLGVNDVKKSDPKKNPLEDSVEDLLKDIK